MKGSTWIYYNEISQYLKTECLKLTKHKLTSHFLLTKPDSRSNGRGDTSRNGEVRTSENSSIKTTRTQAKIVKINFSESWKLTKGLQKSGEYLCNKTAESR